MGIDSAQKAKAVRVSILSDTHGQLDDRLLEKLVGCEYVVHAGDIGAETVLQSLGRAAGNVIAVRGNNDTVAKWRGCAALLEKLPERTSLCLPGGRLEVLHGHQTRSAGERHAELRALYPGARLVVYGHSHRLCTDTARRPWIVNPGAAGRIRTFGGASMVVLLAAVTSWRLQLYRPDRFGETLIDFDEPQPV